MHCLPDKLSLDRDLFEILRASPQDHGPEAEMDRYDMSALSGVQGVFKVCVH